MCGHHYKKLLREERGRNLTAEAIIALLEKIRTECKTGHNCS